jgi:hypothetical protein
MNKYNIKQEVQLWKRRSPDNVGGIEKDLVKWASTENPDVLKQ